MGLNNRVSRQMLHVNSNSEVYSSEFNTEYRKQTMLNNFLTNWFIGLEENLGKSRERL